MAVSEEEGRGRMANGEPEMFFILQLKDDDVTCTREWVEINRSRALKGKAKSKKNYNRCIESPCINRNVFSTRQSFTDCGNIKVLCVCEIVI